MSAASPATAATWSARIRRTLPTGWFGEEGTTPVLDAVLAAFGFVHAQTSSWVAYARLQTRLATATDDFLDGLAADFTGTAISRLPSEIDAAFRVRIRAAVLQPRATRAALSQALTTLTGHAPAIFEPANATDTGGYGVGAALAYGSSGGYGSRVLPYQAFVTVYRPSPALGPVVGSVAGYGVATGGYRVGESEYGPSASIVGVEDSAIYAAIEGVRPAATVIWTRLTNVPPAPSVVATLDDDFILDESTMQ